MEYAQKLKLAKILVTLAISAFTVFPFMTDLNWNAWGNVLAFPVLIYVIWGKLHGTGRSVRLVAFLGMAYAIGHFISFVQAGTRDPECFKPVYAAIFAVLAIAVFLSMKRGTPTK